MVVFVVTELLYAPSDISAHHDGVAHEVFSSSVDIMAAAFSAYLRSPLYRTDQAPKIVPFYSTNLA